MKFEKVSKEQYQNTVKYSLVTTTEYEDIKLPTRATKCSAGYDIFAPITFELKPNETIFIPTGIRWICDRCDVDKVLKLYPKSGLGSKGLNLMNTVGIIDMDYYLSDNEGHIMATLVNRGNETIRVTKGKGFIQGVIQSFYTCDNEKVTEERNGGFGSTNK